MKETDQKSCVCKSCNKINETRDRWEMMRIQNEKREGKDKYYYYCLLLQPKKTHRETDAWTQMTLVSFNLSDTVIDCLSRKTRRRRRRVKEKKKQIFLLVFFTKKERHAILKCSVQFHSLHQRHYVCNFTHRMQVKTLLEVKRNVGLSQVNTESSTSVK